MLSLSCGRGAAVNKRSIFIYGLSEWRDQGCLRWWSFDCIFTAICDFSLLSCVCVGMAGVENSVAARVREALHGANDETLDRMQTLEQERHATDMYPN